MRSAIGAAIPFVPEPRYLLDTNFCVDLFVGRTAAGAERVQRCVEGELVTSSIVYAEIMTGAAQRGQTRAAEAFFRQVPVLAFDRDGGDAYSRLPFKRENFDRLIAAHAIALDLVLVTGDERDFADVPRLHVENWTL